MSELDWSEKEEATFGIAITINGCVVATVDGTDEQAKTLARNIVRRWNAHEDLVKACKAVKIRIAFIGWPAEPMNENKPDWIKEIALLEAALAKAKPQAVEEGKE